MSKQMDRLAASEERAGAIARNWHIIDEILNEQQRIMVSGNKEDVDSRELRGFVIAYRALERFKDIGEKQNNNQK